MTCIATMIGGPKHGEQYTLKEWLSVLNFPAARLPATFRTLPCDINEKSTLVIHRYVKIPGQPFYDYAGCE